MRNHKIFFLLPAIALTFACALPSAPTPIVSTSAASGTVLYQENFDSAASGWSQIANADGTMGYNGGVYRMLVNADTFIFWSKAGRQFTDARIEVDTAAIAGPQANRAGIACRLTEKQVADTIESEFYFFIISSDGYYAIGLAQAGKFTLLGQDQMAFSANISTGLSINHLRADCAGSTLSFYVNGFLVGQVNDSTLTSGDVGLLAGTFEQGGADIVFDQFIVIQP